MKNLPNISERIIVYGIREHVARVSSLKWDDTFFDWIIELDWGELGKSYVKFHDEEKTWYRISDKN